jgi:hypothetical protein
MNVVDVSNKILRMASNDFNSSFLNTMANTTSPALNYGSANISWQNNFVTVANGIDLGGVQYYVGSSASTFTTLASSLPAMHESNNYFILNFFSGGGVTAMTNSLAWRSDGQQITGTQLITSMQNQISPLGTTYISNTSLVPIPLGARYQGYTLGTNSLATSQAFQETYFTSGYQGTTLTAEWDGYILGNELQINSIGFVLYSQPYLFDGKNIFKIAVNNGGISVPITPLVRGDGLVFLTTSFEYAFFYSTFDNSIWTFNGGYTLGKFKRLDGMGAIQNGNFNAFNNTLTLITSQFITQYVDGVWSAMPRPSLMIPDGSESVVRLYDTINGTVMGNTFNWFRYTYFNKGIIASSTLNGIITTETVAPLNYQTSFIGPDENRRMVLSAITFSIYNEAKSATNVVVTVRGYDQDGLYQQPYVQTFKLTSTMFLGGGFIPVLRTQPWKQRFLAASVQFQCSTDMRIYDLHYHWTDENQALPSAARSQ